MYQTEKTELSLDLYLLMDVGEFYDSNENHQELAALGNEESG